MGAQIFTRRPARNNSPGSFPGHPLIPSPSPLIYHHQPVRHLEKNHKTPGPGSAGWGRLRGAAQPSPARLGGARLRSPHAGSCRWDGPARLRSAPVALLRHHRPAPPPGSDAGPPAPASMEEEEAAGAAPLPAPALAELLADGERGPGGTGLWGRRRRVVSPGPPLLPQGSGLGIGRGKRRESGAARCLGCCLHGRDRPLPPVLSPVPAPVPLPAPAPAPCPCPCLPGALPVFPCSSW